MTGKCHGTLLTLTKLISNPENINTNIYSKHIILLNNTLSFIAINKPEANELRPSASVITAFIIADCITYPQLRYPQLHVYEIQSFISQPTVYSYLH